MKHIYLCALLLISSFSFAQIIISGTVTSKNDGTTLPFVNITTENNQGTTTNEDGFYTIEVSNQLSQLKFSYLGLKTQTITVSNNTQIDIKLTEDASALDEVVITALGLERDTKELGYVVQSLKSEDITEVKSVNFLDNLSGKLAGVTISQGATGVGSSSKITIRGEASFSNNNPLFVVDGIPINNNTVFNFTNEAAAGFQEIDFGNGAMEVNSDDIDEVSVLKGPSAAALYGSRASNGVIVIKTKDGKKPKV